MKQREFYVESREVLDLVARAKDGDAQAMELLLGRYQPLLLDNTRKLKARLKGEVLEGHDLEQEAAKIAIELVREYEPGTASSFGSYLKQKLHWRLVNYVRRERKRRGRQTELDNSVADRLVAEMRTRTSLEVRDPRLRSAMKGLSPKQRSVLFKIYWEDRTTGETAEELNVTDTSVRALRRRAEEKIKRSYDIQDSKSCAGEDG